MRIIYSRYRLYDQILIKTTSDHQKLLQGVIRTPALVYILRSLELVASHCHNSSGYFPPESRKSADAVIPNATAPGSHHSKHFFDGTIADPPPTWVAPGATSPWYE